MPKRKFHSVKQNEGQFIYPIHFTLNSIHGFLQILDVTSQKSHVFYALISSTCFHLKLMRIKTLIIFSSIGHTFPILF